MAMSGSTAVPVLKINVDDKKLDDFIKKYNALVAAMAKGTTFVFGGGSPGSPGVPSPGNVPGIKPAPAGVWDAFKNAAEAAYRPVKKIHDTVTGIAHGLVNAVKSLIRFTGIASLVMGVTGFGSLFGMRGLAESASQQRMTALGIGAPTGQINAFSSSYGRYLSDPTGLMGKLADAQHDPAKLAQLAGMFGIQNADKMSVYDLSKAVVAAAPGQFRQWGNNPALWNQLGYGDFISTEEARRLQNTRPGELDRTAREADANVSRLGLSDNTESAWQTFLVHMKNAGTMIENVFITGLTKLTGPLGRLSDAFANLLAHILNNPNVGKWIDDLAHGLDTFSQYITSDKFQQDIDKFLAMVGRWSDGLGNAITSIRGFADVINTVLYYLSYLNPYWLGQQFGRGLGTVLGTVEALSEAAIQRMRGIAPNGNPVAPGSLTAPHQAGAQTFGDLRTIASQIDEQSGLPLGTTWANYAAESDVGRNIGANPGDTARGPFQQTDAYRHDYGVTNPNDFVQEASASATFFRKFILDHAHDPDVMLEARAAYNMGTEATFDAFKQRFGEHWRENLTDANTTHGAAVAAALNRYEAALRGTYANPDMNAISPVQVHINVTAPPGMDAATTTSQNASGPPGSSMIPQ